MGITATQLDELVRDVERGPVFLAPLRDDSEYDAPLLIHSVQLPNDTSKATVLVDRIGWGRFGIDWECVVRDFEVVDG